MNTIAQSIARSAGVRIGANVNPTPTTTIPPFPTDIENGGYTSSQIDAWLINHAFVLDTTGELFILIGNDQRTSASDAAYAHLELTNGFYEDL